MFRNALTVALVLVVSLAFPQSSFASYAPVKSGTWSPGASLANARSGATATLMSDGRVLVAGGFDSSGAPLASVEIYQQDGSVSVGPAMSVARATHAAILLNDGEVLVTGGITSTGNATDSSELFDPVQNVWVHGGTMLQARAQHTLSLLPDGSVLIAGGANSGTPVGVLERYNDASGVFSAAGSLATPRTNHAAAVLQDGRVIVVGGTTVTADGSSQTLSSSEIYDPETRTLTAGPSVIAARSGLTATTTLAGVVVVIGGASPSNSGNGGSAELNSIELFDPNSSTQTFVQSGAQLTTARSGPLAMLLPHNANVLVVGGTVAGAQLASAELYSPWLDAVTSTGAMAEARGNSAGTPLMAAGGNGTDGVLLVTSGQNSASGVLSSSELYGFATIKTDRGDYAPGDPVTITGSGWQPGETVTLSFRESPNIDTPGPFTAVADQNGNVSDMEFAPDLNDVGIQFFLTAVGTSSGLQAQHTFTDGVETITTLTCTPVSGAPAGTWTCTASTVAKNGSAVQGTISFTVSPTSGGSVSPSDCGNQGPSNAGITCSTTFAQSGTGFPTITATFTPHDSGHQLSGSNASFTITPSLVLDVPNPTSVALGSSGPVALTAHLMANGGTAISGVTVTFTIDGTSVGTGLTDSTGTATFTTYNPSGLAVGSHIVQASFPAGSFAGAHYGVGSSNQQTLAVIQVNTTTSINAPAITYGQNGSVTVTVTSGSGTPTGSVSLSFNGGAGVSKTLTNGSATFTNADISGLNVPAANTSGYPLSATYTPDSGSTFVTSTGTGRLVVNPLAVTLTAGGYGPAAYDGNTHALSDCASTQPTFVTCTNSPAGAVGPDVGGATVTPTPVYAQGSVASDFTITNNNGSWSITTRTVILTAGSLTDGVYNGSQQSLSACASSDPTYVTCTNNPAGLVGPGVGSGTVSVATPYNYLKGNANDYAITPVSGSWSITPLAVTLTAGGYGPAAYDGNTHTLSACSSSAATLITCSNSPTGPVGADVGSGTVTPTPVYAAGSVAGDFTISSKNGSWQITPLAVTLTGGSLSGTYNGGAQSPSACVSSNSAFVTCTNSPGTVGPDVVTAAAITPSPSYVKGNSNDYNLALTNGSATITALTVTVTGGSYSGVYDGGQHALSPCTSTYAAGVTCTNNPGGPVGPDVNVGGPTPVIPVVNPLLAGIAADYNIVTKNGSWQITPLGVMLTGGSLNGTYNGNQQSPSACNSSNSAFVTCTNSPASLGPDVVTAAAITPVAHYVQGNSNDYSLTLNNGSATISALTVTVTGGSYSGVYDGATHALSACTSTYATGVTCTNGPAGPVGPDVNVGGPTAVAPVALVVNGIATDYNIVTKNGSWQITPLGVTLTAGGLNTVYNGSMQTVPACGSSAPTFVTCSNSPTSVGPNVGSGAINVSTPYTYAKGGAADYSITPVSGSWRISPMQTTTTITTSAVQYSDDETFTGSVGLAGIAPPVSGTVTVTAHNGTSTYSCTSSAMTGATGYSCATDQIMWAPGTYSVSVVFTPASSNYSASTTPVPVSLKITQEDAAVGYDGTTYFAVPSTQSTVNVPVSFTLQDATATGISDPYHIYDPWPGDITQTGSVLISLSGTYIDSSGTQHNWNSPDCNVAVTAVAGQTTNSQTGPLPSTATTGPCTFGNVPVNGTFTIGIVPSTGSYYTLAAGTDTQVTIVTSNGGGGFITGGGYQTAKYLNSNPSNAGAAPYSLLGALVSKMNFGYIAKYNKSGSNLQASVNVIVRTQCMSSSIIQSLGLNYTPKPGDDGYCLYQIKSNKVVSMTDNAYVSACTSTSCGQAGYGVLVVGANIQDVTQSTAVSLMGGGTLTLQMYDNSEPGIGNDTLTLQVTDNSGRLWFSNSWTGTKTAIYNSTVTKTTSGVFAPVVNGGNLQVH